LDGEFEMRLTYTFMGHSFVALVSFGPDPQHRIALTGQTNTIMKVSNQKLEAYGENFRRILSRVRDLD
jgi:hypothetical protein